MLQIERAHFPDHIVAAAITLGNSGFSSRKAQAVLAEAYGDDAPAISTVQSWFAVIGNSVHEESGNREQRLIALADDLMAEGLASMQGNTALIQKNLMPINAIAGTMRDKQIRRTDAPSQTPHVTIIIESRDTSPIIEATAIRDTDT